MAKLANKDEGLSDAPSDRALTLWTAYLTGDYSHLDSQVLAVRQLFKRLPSATRCRVCNAPFQGLGGAVVSLFGFGAGRSSFNPSLCDRCEKIVKHHQVGTEVQLTLLFADVRGSTALAEDIGPSAFHHLINRFYTASTEVLVQTNALIEKMIGDEVAGLYVPGIAGAGSRTGRLQCGTSLAESDRACGPRWAVDQGWSRGSHRYGLCRCCGVEPERE